jgi:hypothetical protein
MRWDASATCKVFGLGVALWCNSALAIFVDFTLEGRITDTPIRDIAVNNPYGFKNFDTIKLSGMMDFVGVGHETIVFGPGSQNMFSLQYGPVTATNANDISFVENPPTMKFVDGAFDTLSFLTDPRANAATFFFCPLPPRHFFSSPECVPSTTEAVIGIWQPHTFRATPKPIPEPNANLMLAFGLLLLLSVHQRNRLREWPSRKGWC